MDVQRLHAEHHPRIFKTPQSTDFASPFFDEMLADPEITIYIAEEDAQGHGAGTALMDQVEKLARELGVSKIQLDSWDFNIKAHTFFEGPGFEKFDYRFWRNP